MSLTVDAKKALQKIAKEIRLLAIDTSLVSGGSHAGGGLSCVDILTILYFKYLNIKVDDSDWEDRDRFILSKGHAAVSYIPCLAVKGFFPVEQLSTYNKFGSNFGMHPDSLKITGCDVSSGSLGHGLPVACGIGMAARQLGKDFKAVCLLGDGECNEGSNWEAAMAISHFKLANVIAVVDRNRLMIDGPTEEEMGLEPFADKWRAFGFTVIETDGHDFDQLDAAFAQAYVAKDKPVVVIANTVKGKGVDYMENVLSWHYGPMNAEMAEKAKASIEKDAAANR